MDMLDKNNIINKQFSIGTQIRDGIGLGMSKEKLILFKLGNFSLAGIMCSTNDMPIYAPSKLASMKCDSVLLANNLFKGVPGSALGVSCPRQCKDKVMFPIYGTTSFDSRSSICRAALFAGIIDDAEGGEV